MFLWRSGFFTCIDFVDVCLVVVMIAGVVASDDDSVAADMFSLGVMCSAIGSSTVCILFDTVYLMLANFLDHLVQKDGLTNDAGIMRFPAI